MENIENIEKKGSALFKKMDLVFVYLFVFLTGIAIILMMTTFLNNKVKEFNEEAVSLASKK